MNVATANNPLGQSELSVHDKRMIEALVKSLQRSNEKADTALLYLEANKRDWNECVKVKLAHEHIKAALGHLGVEVD